jgi:hypothetical protein
MLSLLDRKIVDFFNRDQRDLLLTFVAEYSTPIFMTPTLPRLDTEAIFASWIGLAFVALVTFVAIAALTDTWSFARSVHASVGTDWFVAVFTTPSGLADLLTIISAGVVAKKVIAGLTKYGAG